MDRRKFLGAASMGAAGLVLMPQLIGCKETKKDKTIRLGFIGLGQQAMSLMAGFIEIPGVEVVAGCDVYGIKRQRFEKRVKDYYTKNNMQIKPDVYEKYQDLLAREDINTVVIATPDHWHAFIAIAACNAKKNVYLEKPLTFTIKEGQELVKAVRRNDVILAVGSQQRSDINFQHAVKMVQEGKIGKIERVNAYVGEPPKPYDLLEQPVPADLNWNLWLGPNEYVHYNEELNPPITLDPEKGEQYWAKWRYFKEVGGGYTTDWGAHMFDIAQWGIGMQLSGPVEIIPAGYENTQFLTYKYGNGIVLTEEPYDEEKTRGVKFWGDKGWIEVTRGKYNASDESLFPPKEEKKKGNPLYEGKFPHYVDFIEGILNHKDPIASVEIGHRTCTVCTLGNIAYELMRPLKWNPDKEQFVDDPEADKHLTKTYQQGYSLG